MSERVHTMIDHNTLKSPNTSYNMKLGKYSDGDVDKNFRNLLNLIDKALDMHMAVACSDVSDIAYSGEPAYDASEALIHNLFMYLADDIDVAEWVREAWLDSNSDIRWILTCYFQEMASNAMQAADTYYCAETYIRNAEGDYDVIPARWMKGDDGSW